MKKEKCGIFICVSRNSSDYPPKYEIIDNHYFFKNKVIVSIKALTVFTNLVPTETKYCNNEKHNLKKIFLARYLLTRIFVISVLQQDKITDD